MNKRIGIIALGLISLAWPVQAQTSVVFSMTAQGSFVATNNPPANMMQIGETLWQSDHFLTNNGTATLRFSANNGALIWGATNEAPVAWPVSGTMETSLTAYAQMTGVVPGRYRIQFNHQTGVFSFQQMYSYLSGVNLLENPGFEIISSGTNGENATDWDGWQAWPKRVADGYAPHSGNGCGVLHGQLFPEWTDHAYYAQEVAVVSGEIYRVSAWFKASDDWTASTMQIKIDWLNASNQILGGSVIENISSLTNAWVQYAVEGIAHRDAAWAQVIFLCSGADGTGTMQMDDAEMRRIAGRTQNFDSWGALTNFTPFSPGWSVTSGRTVWNVPGPGDPYTPGGYSLLMNTQAVLTSGFLLEGIGDVHFWFRTESLDPPLSLVIETAASDSGPWTTAETLTGLASVYFESQGIGINRPDHKYLRLAQTGSETNRLQLDDISISPPSDVIRHENFSGWTHSQYTNTGTHIRYDWTLQNARIDPDSGILNSPAALLSASNSAVISPAYEQGIGEVWFAAKWVNSNESARILLQTAETNGSTWVTRDSFMVTNGNNYFVQWLYLTNNPVQARIIFDPAQEAQDILIDNINIEIPALYRKQTFDGWPSKPGFTNGPDYIRGWKLSNTRIYPHITYDYYSDDLAAMLNQTTNGSAWVQSPWLPDGIGSVSFQLWSTSNPAISPSLHLQVSPNGTNWALLHSVNATDSHQQPFDLYHQDTTNHFIRFVHASGLSEISMDNIRIGTPQPRPEVTINFNSIPAAPSSNDTVQLTADVVTRYGASILSVTGYYKIASGPWTSLEMASVAYGSYASVSSVPATDAGATVRYYVTVHYTGIGAAPASTGYSTNEATSATNIYQTLSISQGDVWINELSYLNVEEDWFVWPQVEDAEFVELCGKAGADISGWSIQLAFGSDADIADNGNQPVYVTYPIASHSFTNQTNGHSFYVLGDQQLLDAGQAVDQALTTYVPTNVAPFSVTDHDHMHNDRGVIRLLNEYDNVVYSLSYGGYASGSERIPTSQELWVTNSVSLTGEGASFEDFSSWNRTNFTIGAVNEGQTLVEDGGATLAVVWHMPETLVTPLNTNVLAFTMRDPINAQSKDNLRIHYGYPDPLYTLPSGNLHYRETGQAWTDTSMSFLIGSRDAETNSYVRGTIPLRTFARGTSIEYVIEAIAGAGTATTYIGLGTTNDYALFESLAEAQAAPFTYTYKIHSELFITAIETSNTSWILYTAGNDTMEPFVNFRVRFTTNPLTATHLWDTNSYTVTPIDPYGSNVFTLPIVQPEPANTFHRIDPLWP